MKTGKLIIMLMLAGMVGGASSYWIASKTIKMSEQEIRQTVTNTSTADAHLATYLPPVIQGSNIDFVYAAEKTVNAVVHVKVESTRNVYQSNPLFEFFYGHRDIQPQPVEGYGSGVIISEDGYIITNNHVVDNADAINVTLNDRRTFVARVIGTDPTTDIALIKIEEKGLPCITYGDSDNLRVGEWVLAVGNPLNLTSTVTAGIVSAKARELGIISGEPRPQSPGYGNRSQTPPPGYGNRSQRGQSGATSSMGIESFIQTDAAVNPGNSGGALVNVNGELVGINTAIASRTGTYSGNSFAVPVTIVKKVVSDLMEYGKVQRAFLGVYYKEITEEIANELKMPKIEGVYVSELLPEGAAEKAGIQVGDVILAINGVRLVTSANMKEQLAKYRPNDKIELTILRKNKESNVTVTLRDESGGTELVRKEEESVKLGDLGAEFKELSSNEKSRLGIRNGVRIESLSNGKLRRAEIKEGFVIIKIDRQTVDSEKDIEKAIKNVTGAILVEGIYPNGQRAVYAVML